MRVHHLSTAWATTLAWLDKVPAEDAGEGAIAACSPEVLLTALNKAGCFGKITGPDASEYMQRHAQEFTLDLVTFLIEKEYLQVIDFHDGGSGLARGAKWNERKSYVRDPDPYHTVYRPYPARG